MSKTIRLNKAQFGDMVRRIAMKVMNESAFAKRHGRRR